MKGVLVGIMSTSDFGVADCIGHIGRGCICDEAIGQSVLMSRHALCCKDLSRLAPPRARRRKITVVRHCNVIAYQGYLGGGRLKSQLGECAPNASRHACRTLEYSAATTWLSRSDPLQTVTRRTAMRNPTLAAIICRSC